jgi:hypothetical protein
MIDAILRLDGPVIIALFFKAFAIFFATIFLIYSIVILKQTKVMNETFTTKNAALIFAISLFQLILAVLLILVVTILVIAYV